jgi:Xaa-Pro aminopeptidase
MWSADYSQMATTVRLVIWVSGMGDREVHGLGHRVGRREAGESENGALAVAAGLVINCC